MQFGTGVLLRGLPDYFIDKANRKGIFNGRIVVVKSTGNGDANEFTRQDGLYTVCVRGIEDGIDVKENIINASISRVLSATSEWDQILECAHNPNLQIIISNTTEVGIQLLNEPIKKHPPVSFPGKLLAFLYERYAAFGGSEQSGMIIIPTELIPDNGKKLEWIVLELAHLNGLEAPFIEWLEQKNKFCSSLVDRIVPGRPDKKIHNELENELGYKDDLLTMAEAYKLWAIEGDERIKQILAFAQADEGVVVTPDINLHRELKLRLLNGTHTLSVAPAILAGFDTVKQAMDDEILSVFISDLMLNELAPSIPFSINSQVALSFGSKVLDRFRNPHIQHHWNNIAMQISAKMKLRNIPILMRHYEENDSAPQRFAIGFAAYIIYMKAVKEENGVYYGERNGQLYLIQDDSTEVFYKRWINFEGEALVRDVLKDKVFWGEDLSVLPGFLNAVTDKLSMIVNGEVKEAIASVQHKNIAV